jgi:hypothetical protein
MNTRPEGRGWAYLVVGLIWFIMGIDKTVLSPGFGSVVSWIGVSFALYSCFFVSIALLALKTCFADRSRYNRTLKILALVYGSVAALLLVLLFVKKTAAMSDFFLGVGYVWLGTFNGIMGLSAFLENPRGQNPGWLYLMVGLTALMWGGVAEYIRAAHLVPAIRWTGAVVVAGIGLYLVAATLILKFSSEIYGGKRRGCGNLMALLAYKTFGRLLLAFYFCVTLVFFGLSFAATTPEMSHFCLYTAWMLLGAGAVWLGVSRIRHWDWI